MITPEHDEADCLHELQQKGDEIADMRQRLALLGQLLTCAVAKLGGEMAVTTTEIDRAVSGQQISLTPLPHNRGFYVALVTYDPGGSNAAPPAASFDLRPDASPRT